MPISKKEISDSERGVLLSLLQARFLQNMHRHQALTWESVQKALEKNATKLYSLYEMEQTGGEPDVVMFELDSAIFFCDCAEQSPAGRRNLCYDREALNSRKSFKPKGTAIDLAMEMGTELLNEAQYRHLQTLGDFDTKTSSWFSTPVVIRKLGGALFADRRFNSVFVYHNGAESYYAARGFRAMVYLPSC